MNRFGKFGKFGKCLLMASLVSAASLAQADMDLMRKNNCTACHTMDKKKYGPHFKEIAAKYANDSGATQKLALKIRAGGSGVWGADVMPPQAKVTPQDALAMAAFILAVE